MGPSTVLAQEEENLLARWIIACANKGFPLNKRVLCETVKDIIESDNRPSPFKDGLPGCKWFNAFLKRHPEVSQRYAESINTARACVSETSIRQWHEDIRRYLVSEKAEDILGDPTRIFNSDESGFATNPKTGLVLGPRGMKNFYEIKSGSEKENITALFTISADGQIYPPMIVYPYERIPAEIVRNTNPDWVIGRSKKGWMSSQAFHSYVCNTFLPYLKRKDIKMPILYLLDGHKSHLTYNLSKFCAQNGIFLYALYPNATHILQPADVALFAPLKNNWKNVVFNWKRANNNKPVNKATFPILLENAVQQVSSDTVKNGFRKCGLYPFDVEAIDFRKCMKDTSRILGDDGKANHLEQLKPTEFKVAHFLYFESVIPSKRRAEFREAEMSGWKGNESAKELFEVWKKLKTRCKESNMEEQMNGDKEEELMTIENNNTEASVEIDTNTDKTCEVVLKNQEGNMINMKEDASIFIETEENRRNNTEAEKEARMSKKISEHSQKSKENPTDEKSQEGHVNILSNVLLTRPMTPIPSNQERQNQRISTSFVDHIFWPEESPEKSDTGPRKERLPYATTSQRWLQYHEDKEKLKMQKEEAKLEKAMLRKQKREEKLKEALDNKLKGRKKNKKTLGQTADSDSDEYEEWQESGTSIDDVSDEDFASDSDNETLAKIAKKEKGCFKGDFYLVSFPGKKMSHKYVCCIQNIFSPNEIEVQAFCAVDGDKSTYKIIENDISTVNRDQLISKLEQPKIIGSGNRLRYQFSAEIM